MSDNMTKLFQDFSLLIVDNVITPVVQHLRTTYGLTNITNDELLSVVTLSVPTQQSYRQPLPNMLPGFPGQSLPQQQFSGNQCMRKKTNGGVVCGKPLFEGTDHCKDCWKLVGVYEAAVNAGRTDIPQFAHDAYAKRKSNRANTVQTASVGGFGLQQPGGFGAVRQQPQTFGGLPPPKPLGTVQGFGQQPRQNPLAPPTFGQQPQGLPQGLAPPTFGQQPQGLPQGFGQQPQGLAPPTFGQQPQGLPQGLGLPRTNPLPPPTFGQQPQGLAPPTFGQQPQGLAPPKLTPPTFGQQPQGLPQGFAPPTFGQQSQGLPQGFAPPTFGQQPQGFAQQELVVNENGQPEAPQQSNNPYQNNSTTSDQTRMSFLDQDMVTNGMSTDGYDNLEKYVVSGEGIIYYNDGDDQNIVANKAVGFLDVSRKIIRALNEEEKTHIRLGASYTPELLPKQHIKPAVNGFNFSQPSRPTLPMGLQPPSLVMN